ncbi:hypothetical protein F5X68DRAFT_232241 [Plectosphaerella plurivora]|uniref:Uncharacterized protein n=1 Tax=Plectosphaerella plurivora TaxID=936078 RepID=A0A9P9AA76_9PEZI|nr:hypothetical protein F5X68DRAFT_232241 [Plectosphaerella plurivora]
MIPKFVLPALLAICSIVSALPATPTANTVELFKRDDPVTERDFELADLHGVNLAESYKHAVIRRDNGDDLTIWVHLSFVEERDDSVAGNLVERQARPIETTGQNDFNLTIRRFDGEPVHLGRKHEWQLLKFAALQC